jgi:hypothetical protein
MAKSQDDGGVVKASLCRGPLRYWSGQAIIYAAKAWTSHTDPLPAQPQETQKLSFRPGLEPHALSLSAAGFSQPPPLAAALQYCTVNVMTAHMTSVAIRRGCTVYTSLL